MLEIMLWVFAAVAAVVALIPVIGALRLRAYVRREMEHTWPAFQPRVTLILPFKGVDPGFRENLESILSQDYPDYEVIFVTDDGEDPGYEIVEKVAEEHPDVPTRLLVAGPCREQSQKLHNQFTALDYVRGESECLVFVDSDVRAQPDFLSRLVEPLQDPEIGATTGFRWYMPEQGGFGSYLRATWNAGGVTVLADPNLAYTWGGAMASLRSTFQEAGVREAWKSALTDDFPLTKAIQNTGRRIHFVPECLTTSHEDSTVRETVNWTNRQTIICRVYNPGLWRTFFSLYGAQALLVSVGAVLAILAGLGVVGLRLLYPSIVMLGIIIVQIGAIPLIWSAVSIRLPQQTGALTIILHALMAPIAVVLIVFNSLYSLATRTIRWRGIAYRLHSPRHTEVINAQQTGSDETG
jgi:cellulose synthase/poly-beta-1,6-N-acetylglucosamine synthase-like glycosyltransferase